MIKESGSFLGDILSSAGKGALIGGTTGAIAGAFLPNNSDDAKRTSRHNKIFSMGLRGATLGGLAGGVGGLLGGPTSTQDTYTTPMSHPDLYKQRDNTYTTPMSHPDLYKPRDNIYASQYTDPIKASRPIITHPGLIFGPKLGAMRMATPIENAHQYGVNEALKQYGYSSAQEVEKAAAELGLFEGPQTTETKVATEQGALQSLASKLRK